MAKIYITNRRICAGTWKVELTEGKGKYRKLIDTVMVTKTSWCWFADATGSTFHIHRPTKHQAVEDARRWLASRRDRLCPRPDLQQVLGVRFVDGRRCWCLTWNGKVVGDSRGYSTWTECAAEARNLVAADPDYRSLDF